MIEFGKANHVTAATAAVAVEQVLAGVHQEAWFVIGVQRTQSHQSTTAEWPGRLPIMSLQIVQQRNLLFQLVESLTTHGLLASIGRIRQTRAEIPGKDGGCPQKVLAFDSGLNPAPQAESVAVVPIGARWMDRASVSDLCSAVLLARQISPAAIRSQACCRQCRLKCADGASQSGKIVKVFLHG